jgi:Holliday junction resolvase RusA-like endonuclease
MKLIIPGILPDLNSVVNGAKRHWGSYAATKRKHTHRVALMAQQAKLPPIRRPVQVRFLWVCKDRRRDKDNVRMAAKYILDGLVEAGVLADDGWHQIVGFEDHFAVDKCCPRVEVELI